MIKQYDIFGLNEEQTKSVILKELKDKKNVNIVSIIPNIKDKINGYNVTVCYEEEILDIESIKKVREQISNFKDELTEKNKEINELNQKKYRIEKNCLHEIVVKTNEKIKIYGSSWEEFYCLICNHCFLSTDALPIKFSKNTKYIYYENDDTLKIEEKVNNALNMFYYEKEQNPNLDDEKIVEKINQKIKVKGK